MRHSDQSLYFFERERVEQSLKEFFPAAGTFTVVFLLFRVYEFILLRGRLSMSVNLASLEFGSIGYDFIFSSALVAMTLIVHILIASFLPRVAYRISTIIFSLLLVLNFVTVQYFVRTLEFLSIDGIISQSSRIWGTMSSSDMQWMTIAPLIVLLPLAIAGFSELRAYVTVHRLSVAHIAAVVLMFNLSWFLPMSPPHSRFQDDMAYHLATNKAYFLMSDAVKHIQARETAERNSIVSK